MLEIIKTEKIGDKILTLVRLESVKEYEIQLSVGDDIVDCMGSFEIKSQAIQEFFKWRDELIIDSL